MVENHIMDPRGKTICPAYELKPGMLLSFSNESASRIAAVEKLDGDRLAFIAGGPDGNTAVAIQISFSDAPPIITHPRTLFYYNH